MTVKTGNRLLLLILPILLGLVYVVETIMPQVTLTRLRSPRLEAFFGDHRVVQISDLHLVKFGIRERLTISALERISPDIIFMTGDHLEPYTEIAELEKFLSRLTEIAPVVATTGNNDYCCLDSLVQVMKRVGSVFLRNESVLLVNGADSLYLVGLEDNFLQYDDYFKAAENVPGGAARIVLGHVPAVAETFDPAGVEVVLAGHLHGGQIFLPFYGPAAKTGDCSYATAMYTAGLYTVQGRPLYSNRGIGTSIVPVRFLSRPEVAVLEFVK